MPVLIATTRRSIQGCGCRRHRSGLNSAAGPAKPIKTCASITHLRATSSPVNVVIGKLRAHQRPTLTRVRTLDARLRHKRRVFNAMQKAKGGSLSSCDVQAKQQELRSLVIKLAAAEEKDSVSKAKVATPQK